MRSHTAVTPGPAISRLRWWALTLTGLALGLASIGVAGGGDAWAGTRTSAGAGAWGDPGHQKPLFPPAITALCAAAFRGPATGSLVKTTSAGPAGSTVMPGQSISVSTTWDPKDASDSLSFISADCVTIGSRVSAKLTQVHNPGPAGGSDHFSYDVPASTGGRPICDRAVMWIHDGDDTDGAHLSGDNRWGGDSDDHEGRGDRTGDDPNDIERSQVLCYTMLAAVAPEAPTVILFPVVALVLGGGGYLVVIRRRRAAERLAPKDARLRERSP